MPGVNDNEGHLFGTHYNKMHYFPEIDKDFKNREGPGPAKYELFSKVIHSAGVQHSFSKVGRDRLISFLGVALDRAQEEGQRTCAEFL